MTDDTTSASAQAEREQFNAWYNPYEFRKEYDKYGPTEAAWSVWQARAAVDKESLSTASAPTGQGAGLTDAEIRRAIASKARISSEEVRDEDVDVWRWAVAATRSAGDGQALANESIECPKCHGTKRVDASAMVTHQLGTDRMHFTEECDHCCGTGHVWPADDGQGVTGLITVRESDVEVFQHPEYGSGLFFTEDCILATPPASPPRDEPQGVTDTDRLDWLDANSPSGTIRLNDIHGVAPRYIYWGGHWVIRLRAAIDAAMSARPQGGETE